MNRIKFWVVYCIGNRKAPRKYAYIPVKARTWQGAVLAAKLESDFAAGCDYFKAMNRAEARKEMMRAFKLARKLARLLGE